MSYSIRAVKYRKCAAGLAGGGHCRMKALFQCRHPILWTYERLEKDVQM